MQVSVCHAISVIAAIVYMTLAAGFVRADRQTHTGGFIDLQGMISGLVTRPAAFPFEHYGRKLDFRNNWEMGAAILVCGTLVFGLSFGALVFSDFVWNWPPSPR